MNNIKSYKEFINETISLKFSDKPYQMYFSDHNIRSAVGAKSVSELLNYAKEKKLDAFEIFKNGSSFHSTTQEQYLIYWKGDGTYWDNMSKKQPELLKKKYME